MPTRVPFTQLRGPGGRFHARNQGVEWTGLVQIQQNIRKRGTGLYAATMKATERLAARMEAYAKKNYVWQDRTYEASKRLRGVAVHDQRNLKSTAFLGHGVGYGLWLEIMQNGKFAIIGPTIAKFRGEVFKEVVRAESRESVFERMEEMEDW